MNRVILLTGANFRTESGWDAFVLNKNYAEAVRRSGALPVLAVDNTSADEYAALADGLILTGGKDVEPSVYGETTPHPSVRCDPERDEMELRILRAFMNANKPVLGICRGLQLLNVFLGGTLWQHLPEDVGEHHESGTVHPVALAPDSVVGTLFGSRILVNSYHHQGVRTLGEDLRATAHAVVGQEQTIVEAFEHTNGKILAVQWHPERMLGASDASLADMAPLFRHFLEMSGIC